jgi:hypothetical protein
VKLGWRHNGASTRNGDYFTALYCCQGGENAGNRGPKIFDTVTEADKRNDCYANSLYILLEL